MNPRRSSLLVIALSISAFAFASAGSQPSISEAERRIVGSYEWSTGGDSPYDVNISFSVWREQDKLILGFQGSHPGAAGAAPEGGGIGTIGSDGVFRFEYQDSFSNRGTGSLRKRKRGYALSINITHLADSRCAMFYGDFVVRRVSSKPGNISPSDGANSESIRSR